METIEEKSMEAVQVHQFEGNNTEPLTLISKFDFVPSAVAELKSKFLPLVISGIDDTEGLAAVHDARMIMKGHRVNIEKKRKDLTGDAVRYQRNVNAIAKYITSQLEPIEEDLQRKEDIVENEKRRLREEKIRLEEERIAKEREAEIAKRLEEERLKMEKELAERKERLEREEAERLEKERILNEKAETYRNELEEKRNALREQERLAAIDRKKKEDELAEQSRIQKEKEEAFRIEQEEFKAQKAVVERECKLQEEQSSAFTEEERLQKEVPVPEGHDGSLNISESGQILDADNEKIIHLLRMACDFDDLELQTSTYKTIWEEYKKRTTSLCLEIKKMIARIPTKK
jgi:hypothetical protein